MIYAVTAYTLLAVLCLGAFSWAAGGTLLRALAEHLGSSDRPRLHGPRRYQEAAERHMSERVGFSKRVR